MSSWPNKSNQPSHLLQECRGSFKLAAIETWFIFSYVNHSNQGCFPTLLGPEPSAPIETQTNCKSFLLFWLRLRLKADHDVPLQQPQTCSLCIYGKFDLKTFQFSKKVKQTLTRLQNLVEAVDPARSACGSMVLLRWDNNVLRGFQTAIFCPQVPTSRCSEDIKDDEWRADWSACQHRSAAVLTWLRRLGAGSLSAAVRT